MHVLLVEDDGATAQTIELMLKSEGFSTNTTDLGEEGLGLARLNTYDLILLDLNLPDMSGFDVLQKLREEGICTPIIIISGSLRVHENTIRGLNAGADDYLPKPFHKAELVVRMRAVVRRSNSGSTASIITTGNVAVNLDSKSVRVQGVDVCVTPKEYALLELLSLRKGDVVTRDVILRHLYTEDTHPQSRTLDVFMVRLRKKIAGAGDGTHPIVTVRGEGFVLREVSPEGADAPLSG